LIEADKGSCPLETEDGTYSNPLIWWKDNAARFPYVANANAARKFLAIPAISTPSERV
jgi:hypothetical protein